MEVCKELKQLSDEFNKLGYKLYIVGGYVRNELLGLPKDDIDIASNLSVEQLNKICKKLNFKTVNTNSKLGTVIINVGDKVFEYTRFRKESYKIKGEHTPDDVEFVEDLATDCDRRDFTINSLYFDINDNVIIDLVRGQKDLQKKIIKTTCDPDQTLSDDGLRILRAVRFASALGFEIEKKTLKALKVYSSLLCNVSKERILRELSLIVSADLKYGQGNKSFIKLCNKLNLYEYIFNARLGLMRKIKKSDIDSFFRLTKDARRIGFYVLVLKNYLIGYTESSQLGYNINMLLGRDGIKESLDNIFTTEKIYRIYQNLEFRQDELNASINYLTLSNSEREIIDLFLSKKAKTLLSDKMSYIKDNNLPLNIHQLDIQAKDLIDAGIEKKYISKIMSTLFNQVLNISVQNEKNELIKLAKEINETFNKIKELS